MKALCLKDGKFTESIKAGQEYEVVELYTCQYEGDERVIIQCEDGQRDCFSEDFIIKP